jgi:prepilin-type N-terminal cleavage/methylation domain-containing protein
MNKKAFTLVELIVVITILAVLATVAFISFQWYALSARDSTRLADLNSITKVLELYNVKHWKYPNPDAKTNITYSWSTAWTQWVFGISSYSDWSSMSNVPVDPVTGLEYPYSVTSSRWEYSLAAVLENPISSKLSQSTFAWTQEAQVHVKWNYNGKFLKVRTNTSTYLLWVPSILASDITSAELETILTNERLVYKGYKNLPASYSGSVYNTNPTDGFPFWTWSYVANDLVLFMWDTNDLEIDSTKRVDFLEKLQTSYSGSVIESESDIAELLGVDSSSSSAASNYVATALNNSLKTDIEIATVINTWTEWLAAPLISPFPECYDFDPVNQRIDWFKWWICNISDIAIDGIITIPAEIDGIAVTTIWGYAMYTKIFWYWLHIQWNIKYISNNAFSHSNITSLTLWEWVEDIRDSAFLESQIPSLDLPSTIKNIWSNAFAYGSPSLTSLSIPVNMESIDWKILSHLTSVENYDWFISNEYIYLPDWVNIKIVAYLWSETTDLIIPSTINGKIVTGIWKNAFYNANLVSITMPNTITSIWDYAFSNNNLTSIILPNNLTSIWNSTFQSNSLNSIIFPNTLTTIWDYTFDGNSLTSATFPNNLISIWRNAFYGNSINNITFWNSLTTIWQRAFQLNQLTEVSIPSSVNDIGLNSFSSNSINIANITIYCPLPTMWSYIFSGNWWPLIQNPTTCTP